MNVMKVMEILYHYETQAVHEIRQDNDLKIDNYESVGKLILIKDIRKKIKSELFTSDDKEAA